MLDLLLVYSYIFLMRRYVITPLSLYESLGEIFTIVLLFIPAYCYHLFCEVLMNGQSVGKKALGIRVMDLNGNEPSLSQYLLRWSFRLFDMVMTLGAGAVLSTALSKHTQRIGDIVAGTVVIDQKAQTQIRDTIYLDLDEMNYQPVFPQVMQLSDRDINGIHNLLDTKTSGRDTEIYIDQVKARILEVLKIETDLEARPFLSQLLKDYNFLSRQ